MYLKHQQRVPHYKASRNGQYYSKSFFSEICATGRTRKEEKTNNVAVNKECIGCDQHGIWPLTNGFKYVLKRTAITKQRITERRCAKEFLFRLKTSRICVLSSQSLQWHSTPRPACCIVVRKRCSSDGRTSSSRQKWDRVIAEAKQVVSGPTIFGPSNQFSVFTERDPTVFCFYLEVCWLNTRFKCLSYRLLRGIQDLLLYEHLLISRLWKLRALYNVKFNINLHTANFTWKWSNFEVPYYVPQLI
jgi:hypothetical protein